MGNSKDNTYNVFIFAKPNSLSKKIGIKILGYNSVEKISYGKKTQPCKRSILWINYC